MATFWVFRIVPWQSYGGVDWAFRKVCVNEGYRSDEFAHFVEDIPFLGYLISGRKSIKCAWFNLFELLKSRSAMNEKPWKAFPDDVLSCPCLYGTFLIFLSLLLFHTCSEGVGLGDASWMTELWKMMRRCRITGERTQLVRQGVRHQEVLGGPEHC